MAGLVFVGLGFSGASSLSFEGLELLKSADKLYLEVYTSPTSKDLKSSLESITGSKVTDASREFIEDGNELIDESKRLKVALVAYGDPMVATTHMDLRVRAISEGVHTSVIHNASIFSALPGETGLHVYRMGKIVTFTRSSPTPHTTVYNTVFENLERGLHTLVLLEYDLATCFFFDPSRVVKELLETEAELSLQLFDQDTFIIVASRIGFRDQEVKGGRIASLHGIDFGEPPHTIIVPGKLHFTEVEAIESLLKINKEEIRDNSARVERLAKKMVKRYVKKGVKALSRAVSLCNESEKERYATIFENVECYMSDSERFLNQGRDELAVLSIGYAEGLLDALRFLSEKKFDDIWN